MMSGGRLASLIGARIGLFGDADNEQMLLRLHGYMHPCSQERVTWLMYGYMGHEYMLHDYIVACQRRAVVTDTRIPTSFVITGLSDPDRQALISSISQSMVLESSALVAMCPCNNSASAHDLLVEATTSLYLQYKQTSATLESVAGRGRGSSGRSRHR